MAEFSQDSLTVALLVIFVGITVIPALAKRLRLPVIVTEIVFGVLIGKSLLDIVPEHETIQFFSAFGLVYLMFLAGLEIDFLAVRAHFKRTVAVALFSITIPFISGALLAPFAGTNPLLLGTVFSTTSLGIVLPLTKELEYKKEVMAILLGSVVLVDILSMFLLGFSLTTIEGSIGWEFFYALAAILVLFLLPWVVTSTKIQQVLQNWLFQQGHFQDHVRFSFALIFILAAISGTLGFHSIIGAFIAGLVISEITPQTSRLTQKLESFGYGFFIPLFFIFMGAKVNLPSVFGNLNNIMILTSIIVVGILSKVVGVTFVSKIAGLTGRESLAYGLFHSARLSLIIAAAEIGSGLGLFNDNLFSIFVLLAVVSALVGPSLGKAVLLRTPRETAPAVPADARA